MPPTRRPRTGLAATAAVLALVGGAAAAVPAAAQAPATAVTVTPDTGLLDRQEVEVNATGYAPNANLGSAMCDPSTPATLADCDLGTAVTSTVADATGSATFTRPVVRYIATNDGPRDCAVEACVLAVAQLDGLVPDLSTAASAPIALAPVPVADGLTVAYDPPAYLEVDPAGPVTVPAVLGCDDSTLVSVTFRLWQPRDVGVTNPSNTILVDCEAGTPLAITSDQFGFEIVEGPAEVMITATTLTGDRRAVVLEDVEISPFADVLAAWVARWSDPSDTTAVSDFFALLEFRLTYNPFFAQAFWRAVLGAG